MKLNIKNSFKNKNFKYGGYTVLLSLIAIVIFIVINLAAGKLNLKYDLTKNKLYSLSDQTYKILSNLKDNVDIYVFSESGKEDYATAAIIDKYKAGSKKINVQYKDPIKYPEFAKEFNQNGSETKDGSIVIKSGSKFKLIDPNDLINYSYDANGQASEDSLAIEEMVTGGILYVTSKEMLNIAVLTDHQEIELPSIVTKQLQIENYSINNVNLLLKDAKLDISSVLLVASPQRDLELEEVNVIKKFLSKGGRAVFLMDITKNDLPNFKSVLESYGVGLKRAVVVEGDANHSTQNPIYLVPSIQSQEIVNVIKSNNTPITIPVAQIIETLNPNKSTTVEPLLVSSSNSWGKINLQATTLSKESGDLKGPFNVAVAVTDKAEGAGGKDTKLIVVSNGAFISEQFAGSGGNMDFFLNSLSWLQDKKETISIRPRSLIDGKISMSSFQQLTLSAIVVIIIPGIIIIWGIIVLKKRVKM